ERLAAERPEPPFARQRQRRAPQRRLARGDLVANLAVDSRRAEILADSARAVAPPQQAAAARARIGGVVDVAERDVALDQPGHVGLAFAVPPALAQLALEIPLEFRRARREPCNVG